MDRVSLVLSAVAVLIVVALAVLPLKLSWPQRVRWTVASQSFGHMGPGPLVYLPLDLREAVLVSVETHSSELHLGVREDQHPACHTMIFVAATEPTAEVESMLREWCALRTPMLLHIDRAGVASLHGPAAAVEDLRRIAVTAPQAA
jgi:hypothetical protein